MSELSAQVVAVGDVTGDERARMLALMSAVYDGVDPHAFAHDLAAKDEAILLRTGAGELVGFSTQRRLTVEVADPAAGGRRRSVEGVFSGDTVIHPDHWGSPALFQAFARRYVTDAERYWFLISKGVRTYRMLPLFFERYWPSRHAPTPAWEQAVMDAYAGALYPDAYDPATGVLAYPEQKDRLRPEHAGEPAKLARNPDSAFFVARNPGYVLGHDLVCLARLSPDQFRPRALRTLLG